MSRKNAIAFALCWVLIGVGIVSAFCWTIRDFVIYGLCCNGLHLWRMLVAILGELGYVGWFILDPIKEKKRCGNSFAVERLKENEMLMKENKELRLLLFSVVRNGITLPIGLSRRKSEQEITDMTFENIQIIKGKICVDRMINCMNLATDKENRYEANL